MKYIFDFNNCHKVCDCQQITARINKSFSQTQCEENKDTDQSDLTAEIFVWATNSGICVTANEKIIRILFVLYK